MQCRAGVGRVCIVSPCASGVGLAGCAPVSSASCHDAVGRARGRTCVCMLSLGRLVPSWSGALACPPVLAFRRSYSRASSHSEVPWRGFVCPRASLPFGHSQPPPNPTPPVPVPVPRLESASRGNLFPPPTFPWRRRASLFRAPHPSHPAPPASMRASPRRLSLPSRPPRWPRALFPLFFSRGGDRSVCRRELQAPISRLFSRSGRSSIHPHVTNPFPTPPQRTGIPDPLTWTRVGGLRHCFVENRDAGPKSVVVHPYHKIPP